MILIIKPARKIFEKEVNRTVTYSKYSQWLHDENLDFNCKFGIIKKADFKKDKITLAKETFYILPASFYDEYKSIERNAQIITLKDVGAIITSTGINRDSKVLDAGTGSGALACYLAKICKEVVSIDIEKDNTEVGKRNAERLGIRNISFKTEDISKFKGKDFDVFSLDIPEPWNAFKTAINSLKRGGFLITYTPQIEQAMNVVRKAPEELIFREVKEVDEQKWAIDDKRSKPLKNELGHTAFLTVFRKL